MSCVQNAGVFLSLVIRQTVCVDSSLSKVKVKTVDWNRGTPHSQSMSDVAYINKSYISTSTFCTYNLAFESRSTGYFFIWAF